MDFRTSSLVPLSIVKSMALMPGDSLIASS